MNQWMNEARKIAQKGIEQQKGGPFGAVVIDKSGNIIGRGENQVLKTNDPTAHAEIVAIRDACKNLKTYDLSDCTIYTSCEPCPMCLSAVIWSNIKMIYYGCTREDAEEIGFRDNLIYDFLKGKSSDMIQLKQLERKECIELFKQYVENGGIIY